MTFRPLFILLLGISTPSSSQIVINEVLYDPLGTDTGGEKIEIANLGLSAVDLTGYDLYPDGIGYFTFSAFTLNGGSIVVIHLRQSGTNTATDLYHDTPAANMGNTAGSIALFSSATHSSSTIVSFVQWGSGSRTWSGDAVTAGAWSVGTDFVPGVTEGHSLEYDGGGNAAADWFDQSSPTIGGTNALPVQMAEFDAEAGMRNVKLRWRTETETDNYGFEVERRTVQGQLTLNFEPETWNRIGFVRGSGTSPSSREYSFVDRNVPPGRYAYRIKQVDLAGTFAYTDAVEVDVGLAPREFRLSDPYPNPFNPTTAMEFSVPEDGRAMLKIYNLLGQEVATLLDEEMKAGVYHRIVFDASRIASGVYVASLESGAWRHQKRIVLLK